MSDVSVIGLGPMGLVLADLLVRSGRRVTVWNRTTRRADGVVQAGAVLAPTVAAAAGASPICIVCVANYATSDALVRTPEVAKALAGRILVQLSTGSPQEARSGESWSVDHGTDYLDGAILATPEQMGRPDTPIFLSGSEGTFERAKDTLRILGGTLLYVGRGVGGAAAWDIATLCCLFGASSGFLHGARVLESEGLRVDALGSMFAQISPVVGEMIKQIGEDIQTERYGNPASPVRICAASADLFAAHAHEAEIDARFPTFLAGLFNSAVVAGYGEERLAAVIKVLRESPAP